MKKIPSILPFLLIALLALLPLQDEAQTISRGKKKQATTKTTTKKKTTTANRSQKPRTSGSNNKHEFVDLGLSVNWATCNVGASKPSDYGDYYAWGETTTKKDDNYKYDNKNSGSDIGGTRFDVAHVRWGAEWRMPTDDECEELIYDCTWILTTMDGHMGYEVIGPSGNSIFLPAAGTDVGDAGKCGYYRVSTSYGNDMSSSPAMTFFDSGASMEYKWQDNYGTYSIRPVSTKKNTMPRQLTQKYTWAPTQGDAIDLGLSVKWSSCNLGAAVPSDYGNYYAWGETKPKSTFTEENYNGKHSKLQKDISRTEFDPVYKDLGGNWRMPTENEFKELINQCTWTWTVLEGHRGYKVTGKNGNSIFLPAVGHGARSIESVERLGGYWCGTQEEKKKGMYPQVLVIHTDKRYISTSYHYEGLAIRPVTK